MSLCSICCDNNHYLHPQLRLSHRYLYREDTTSTGHCPPPKSHIMDLPCPRIPASPESVYLLFPFSSSILPSPAQSSSPPPHQQGVKFPHKRPHPFPVSYLSHHEADILLPNVYSTSHHHILDIPRLCSFTISATSIQHSGYVFERTSAGLLSAKASETSFPSWNRE